MYIEDIKNTTIRRIVLIALIVPIFVISFIYYCFRTVFVEMLEEGASTFRRIWQEREE